MKWKNVTIKGYENLYKISDSGDVLSVRSGRLLSPKIEKTGYVRVTLSKNGVAKRCAIHRLVALAFIDNPDGKPTVNHKNENKKDNRVENLEWATNAEQNVYGTRIKRAVSHTDYKGRKIDYKAVAEKHNYNNENMCHRMPVSVWRIENGELILFGKYKSQKEASQNTGVSKGKVSQCVSGVKISCKGFVFKAGD